jgi:hypothetical protein
MELHYKSHYITATADRDPDNNLFRAEISIKSVVGGAYTVSRHRYPPEGTFASEGEAELRALEWAQKWVDADSSSA